LMTMTQPWTTHRLLPDQLGLAPEAAAHKALRTRSVAVADALALSCTAGAHSSETLKRLVLTQGPPSSLVRGPRLGALAAMAMIWAGSASSPDDLEAAAIVVDHLWGDGTPPGLSADQHLAAGQILFLAGRHTRLGEVLPLLEGLDPTTHHYMVTDLANPFLDPSAPAHARLETWSELLSGAFTEHGLSPLALLPAMDEAHSPFDRLNAPGSMPGSASGELVTVIMPCYQPDRGLISSVRSISRQTWADLEIVVVDDASGPGFDDIFAEAVDLDPRAQLLRLERNGGSYLAREAAIAQTTGSLVTFQDADDWSHPSRIEHQVAVLAASSAPMSRSHAVRAKDDLTHQWLGSEPIRPNASSLMVRRTVLEQWGGFVPVRKGADSEFAERITNFAGAIADTNTPLAITRLRSGSLSRGDFMYHWTTPDRTAFRTAFQAWHRELRADVDGGRVTSISTAQLHDLPFPVPLSWVRDLPSAKRTPTTLDVAYVGNFSTVEPSRAADALRRSIK
ncbi:MAG: glycosyltransferase family A protein, partial [Ornithinimicrobium sp.]